MDTFYDSGGTLRRETFLSDGGHLDPKSSDFRYFFRTIVGTNLDHGVANPVAVAILPAIRFLGEISSSSSVEHLSKTM